jgi:hypothetical protein
MPLEKSPVTPPGIDPGTFRLVAQCLNHYVTPCPVIKGSKAIKSLMGTTPTAANQLEKGIEFTAVVKCSRLV